MYNIHIYLFLNCIGKECRIYMYTQETRGIYVCIFKCNEICMNIMQLHIQGDIQEKFFSRCTNKFYRAFHAIVCFGTLISKSY